MWTRMKEEKEEEEEEESYICQIMLMLTAVFIFPHN